MSTSTVPVSPPPGPAPAPAPPLSGAARARAERNRLRARALLDARLAPAAAAPSAPAGAGAAPAAGGGFLLETAPPPPRAAAPPPAPLQPPDQPACLDCGRRFPASYLLDTFHFCVCDDCRDEEGAHALLTRTEAKAEFLLKDCDLDAREPPLPFVRRPNPHRGGHDMRLYLRAQVERRALLVWGSEAALLDERALRDLKRAESRARQEARRLRALRMDVRSSLFSKARDTHVHRWGPERADGDDYYSRECLDCGHTETYEKM